MRASVAADAVVVAHLAYLAFVALGGILAWRWPRLIWFHLAAVTWAVSILVVGQDCPLTDLQRLAERWAAEPADDRGFVDRYLEGVLFPERATTALRLLMGALVVIGWVGWWRRHHRATALEPTSGQAQVPSSDSETTSARFRVGRGAPRTIPSPALGSARRRRAR